VKNISVHPVVLIVSGILIAASSFTAGDFAHHTKFDPYHPISSNIDFSSLNDIYSLMENNFDGKITPQAALDGAKKGLVAAGGDPYTVYMDATESKSLSDQLSGKLSGIGAQIGIKNNYLTVIAPIASSPAQAAGLKAGDIIIQIDGTTTTGMSVDTAVSLIRGKAGTKVTLKIARGAAPLSDITITRADLTIPSVTWSIKNGDIGYIQISTFGTDTSDLIVKAATDLKAQGAKKIILDLRNDGGGYLDAGVVVASQFLPQGKLVVEERTDGKSKDKLTAQAGGILVGMPTVVLINGGSASASEIVSGALHDNGVAKLVGEKSFGKGSVQEIKQLGSDAQLKVTIAHWYTPAGININKEGIQPDVTVTLTSDDFNASRDPQLDKALQLLQ
jgi:carboxyl-terminal processing protease